ncbi:uncharacterized protein LOC62_01G000129 [Vanrija pseudolonga]|uniref:Uncharacterized protein n=1 Tax=Vanrija pseudolonga TaxID=143232 RepID=A0AAF0Y1T4_9TREE|nr:hypothetical protein LOC62_01G000129 [Vanrija pseudolonga]
MALDAGDEHTRSTAAPPTIIIPLSLPSWTEPQHSEHVLVRVPLAAYRERNLPDVIFHLNQYAQLFERTRQQVINWKVAATTDPNLVTHSHQHSFSTLSFASLKSDIVEPDGVPLHTPANGPTPAQSRPRTPDPVLIERLHDLAQQLEHVAALAARFTRLDRTVAEAGAITLPNSDDQPAPPTGNLDPEDDPDINSLAAERDPALKAHDLALLAAERTAVLAALKEHYELYLTGFPRTLENRPKLVEVLEETQRHIQKSAKGFEEQLAHVEFLS